MTDLHKRSLLKVAALSAVAAAALVGCGKKEEAKPVEAPKPVASAPAPAKPEPQPEEAPKLPPHKRRG